MLPTRAARCVIDMDCVPSWSGMLAKEMDREPHHEAANVQSGAGVVREVKPDGAMVEMTPTAAVITAVRLLEAASKADGDNKLAAEEKARQRG